ncbi:helix-turn-helix transcriptional regulator [Serratia symbiotica]|uniref:Helix-turn-helix transcriptional regulator n=2 Tax=Serratia symbiotica TaxID=138074 RepID=A0A068YWW9_9GAMM|nr:AraC family transcriptional regulator [Serratia symbiotica]MBF1994929.1 helix-turn-helix transcriptional regulator [Serratia symbiotica]MBQ0954959.1 helix-turn-helix transcriptional regulator [Serratia symbiotica]QLH63960.1 helix-turn-helix transcriptional regulator [Serratia symbiotica]QTP14367.1 helix-turn-helix transcriptional regulator [Serratia symbiotica]CDS56122.1 Transcriptional regulator, AraC family [Serratia symbiotica]
MTESPRTKSEISIHQLVVGEGAKGVNMPDQCELLRYSLQEGMDILLWRGHFSQPTTLPLHDDLGRINFSCILEGSSRIALHGAQRHLQWELQCNCHYVTHTPDCHGSAFYYGSFESITLSLSPAALTQWVPDNIAAIRHKIDSHDYCQQQRYNAETHLTAQALRHALTRLHDGFSHEQKPANLWLQGQSLVMLSLMLDEYHEDDNCLCDHFNPTERQKLLRAKDLLLADLTQAPTIAELARETGLSVLKTKRGFRTLFNNSVYGLFQLERMQEARRRLANGNASVMTVAADLGYTNASHFSVAFQKQFGVNPSTFKRLL